MLRPPLPPPRSWYPGHMSKFARQLPALLARTDVVLELRDARLPLTSVHPALEGEPPALPCPAPCPALPPPFEGCLMCRLCGELG